MSLEFENEINADADTKHEEIITKLMENVEERQYWDYELIQENAGRISRICAAMKCTPETLSDKVDKLLENIAYLESELQKRNIKIK